ncbi:histidine kinase dimerization/phosphoacceptor domain -containing protein [Sphingobium sp. CR2-8]|uniref:sensor histidine kinase n=1 Tax=Sphingobium sp. CR2-8 TaxID=1306534 RepID=UPI002DBD52E2|nr:histidine kinase dimerization/phosphoacceptor domain -containing protein [Sphingobium sp. CR2-8]MEC3911732.1 histidine kinase dimerization/phosphoacceptor domain -containing protein [Sphingobium sp. CR2-8]
MQRTNERFVERLPLVMDRPVYAYLLTTVFCAAALLLRIAAEPLLPSGYPFVTFFPAVILSSFLFGVRPGIFAGIVCGIISWYAFIPPFGGFALNPAVMVAMLFYTGVVAIDIALIHFMQRANFNLGIERERSRALAENRELLFHELQHRVSNNLQVVAAMLSLQRRHVDNDVARRALDDASARLSLVGRISRALYDPSGAGQDVRAFLTTLTADIVDASGRQDVATTVIAPTGLRLDPDITVPLALVVAESVSNAIEHGLPDRAGHIHVTLEAVDGALALQVADDGRGIAPDVATGQVESLGLRIAHALAAQLGGRFALVPSVQGGAVARLDLPARLAC